VGPGLSGRLLAATRSPHKLAELRELLAPLPVVLIGPGDLSLEPRPEEEALESADAFAGNAIAKARYFHARAGIPVLADDSGLCVDALGGGPGVRTKRFAPDEWAESLGRDAANNAYLLEQLAGVEEQDRGAHYRCALALVWSEGGHVCEGRVDGRIADAPRGSGGFGYDPLFVIPEVGKTFAELDPGVKARMSHRARAAAALRAWWELEGIGDSDRLPEEPWEVGR